MRRVITTFIAFVCVAAAWVGFGAPPAGAPPTVVAESRGLRSTRVVATVAPATTTLATIPDPTVPSLVPAPVDAGQFGDLVGDLEEQLADPRLAGLDVSASVWFEGHGVVFTHNPGLVLYPASNQKLLTGVGALGLLPADFRFTTEVALSGTDLFLIAGGDPTLTLEHLDRLAEAVAGEVTDVTGLVVDATRYEAARMAPGWLDWQMPTYVGPLSTFVVNDNRHRTDDAYLTEPDLGNAELLRDALERAGVSVGVPTVAGVRPPEARTLVTLDSAGRDALVARLLTSSDNVIAESLVREIGFVTTGQGDTLAGLAAIEEYAKSLGASLQGEAGDGSGLSRANLRSAGEWTSLLVAAREADWWPTFYESLAVAGRTGTLANRLGGDATAGNVRAKTGSIIGGRSLSGVLEDRAGRTVVFSLVVNGETAGSAIPVFDRLVETLAEYG